VKEEKMEDEETKMGQPEELIGNEKEIAKLRSEIAQLRKEIAKLRSEKRDIAIMLTEAEMKAASLKEWSEKVKDNLRKVLDSHKKQAQEADSRIFELTDQNKLLRQKLAEENESMRKLLNRIEWLRISAEKFEEIRKLFVEGAFSKESLLQEIKEIVFPVEVRIDVDGEEEK
jgi:chromosome segregation ATPase